jgi:hypothetical protein
MAIEGMDVEGIQTVLTAISNAQEQLTSALSTLTTSINANIGAPGSLWVGPDATTFASNWQQDYAAPLTNAINQLNQASTAITSNQSAQTSTSAT